MILKKEKSDAISLSIFVLLRLNYMKVHRLLLGLLRKRNQKYANKNTRIAFLFYDTIINVLAFE